MSVLIAIPTGSHVENDVIVSLWKLDKAGHDVDLAILRGYDVAKSRNELAKYALGKDYTHVLMVDSDTVLPEDALLSLMPHDVGVCLGYYPRSDNWELSTLVPGGSGGTFSMAYVESCRDAGKLFKVKRGGLGCALIKAEVFRKLKYPWFRYVDDGNGQAVSEDYYFCDKCRDAGIAVYADPRVSCGHILKVTV